MTRIEEIEKASKEYRESREECGVKDPILLDEVDDAHFMGAIWADEHPIHLDEAMPHILYKGALQGKKEMLDKACEWLNKNKDNSFIKCEDPCLVGYLTDEFIEEFKKAMEDKE